MVRMNRVAVVAEDIGRHNGPFRVTEGLLKEFAGDGIVINDKNF